MFNIRNAFFTNHPGANRLTNSPAEFISTITPTILVFAGLIFFILILLGGFTMITGAGNQPTPQEAAKSKAAITYGVIGFLLVITAYFILQIVGVITGIDFTDLKF